MSDAFRYRAATASGGLVQGVVQAGSVRDAAEELRRQALIPISIDAATRQAAPVRRWSRSVGRRERGAVALRTMATLLASGVSLERALDFACRQATDPELAAAFRAIQMDVQRGRAFSETIRQQSVFGAFPAAVIHAGEESGTLDQAMSRLADWIEREQELRSEVRNALLYPALMGIVAGVGVTVLLTFVVPRFVAILGDVGGELPLSTRMLVGASTAITSAWWLWVIAIAGVVLSVRWWLQQPDNRRRWHAARLRLPISGSLERDAATARFAGALGVMLEGGSPVLVAVRIAGESVTNEEISGGLRAASERIARGEGVAASLGGTLSPLAVELMAAGEEGGRLPELCARVASAHEQAVARKLQALVRMIEPALILVFGAVVGFIALAMLQAVYSVNIGVL